MSALRTRLEEAQARVNRLDAELRNFPAKSAEREALEALEALVKDLEQKAAERERVLAKQHLDLEALRVRFSETAWWRSLWLLIPASVVGIYGGIWGAVWALQNLDWYLVAESIGWGFAAVPLVVNGTRFVLGRRKLARRRQLGGGMKTE